MSEAMSKIQSPPVDFQPTEAERRDGDEPVRPQGLRPALFSGYRDLVKLRHDFPLVLTEDASRGGIRSLSDIVDQTRRDLGLPGLDHERLNRLLLRLEDEIRDIAAAGTDGTLVELWERAASNLLADADEAQREWQQTGLERARSALASDGEVVGCDRDAPWRILTHVWRAAEAKKAQKFSEEIGDLALKLSNILRADSVKSGHSSDAARLRRSVGSSYETAFDFQAMAEILQPTDVANTLSDRRRRRIRAALATLDAQTFVDPANGRPTTAGAAKTHDFIFDRCVKATEAFSQRLPEMVGLVQAMTVAHLEIENRYRDAVHDPFFDRFGEDFLEPGDLAAFPSYLVCLSGGEIEQAEIAEILSVGLPIKILLRTDDILADRPIASGRFSFGAAGSQLAAMALGLGHAFVLQSSVAGLYRLADAIASGLAQEGPALFHIYAGAPDASQGTPAYLRAAAATESRAFPTIVNDPARGGDRSARFSLIGNPQPDSVWPVHHFCYEDEELQRRAADIAFTFADFAATDARHAARFTYLPRSEWSDSLVPVADYLELDDNNRASKEPYIWLVDDHEVLHRAVVDARLIDGARRAQEMWRHLQQLTTASPTGDETAEASSPVQPTQPAPQATPEPTQTVTTDPAEASADEPSIETVRCTTCDECTQINSRMFAYNDDKQAFIVDVNAGTYRDLVDAAESCQVAIIKPGKPKNANEPGLEDLIARAEAFT